MKEYIFHKKTSQVPASIAANRKDKWSRHYYKPFSD
uniref:Uncharacterized protein n=1 Tax=Anguilla anguilla TaxID=7936 RepID=A0A0E9UXL1_ANGAN